MRRAVVFVTSVAILAFIAPPVAAQNIAQTAGQTPAAQAKEPGAAQGPAAEALRLWNSIGRRLMAMAEDFPEDKYDFKPNPEVRTLAEQLLHVAGTNYELISAVKGSQVGPGTENPSRQTYKTKADVVALLKKSIEDGAALIKGIGDAGISKPVKYPYANQMVSPWFIWAETAEHSGEHYGQLVVYYRVNGMVPPASRPRK